METPTSLTERQSQIINLIAKGNTNDDMSVLLGISRKTVEKHRQSLYEALNAHCTAEALVAAIRRGFVKV